jgi:hypothetical protein
MLKFSDGMEFDLEGPPRIEKRKDGLYVVGMGLLIPVDNREEGKATIAEMLEDEQRRARSAK